MGDFAGRARGSAPTSANCGHSKLAHARAIMPTLPGCDAPTLTTRKLLSSGLRSGGAVARAAWSSVAAIAAIELDPTNQGR